MRMSLLEIALVFMTAGLASAQIPLRPMQVDSVPLWPVYSGTHRYTPPACSDSALAERELAAGPVYDTLSVTDKPRLLQAGKHREPLTPAWLQDRNGGRVSFSFVIDSLGQIEPCSWRTLYATSEGFEAEAYFIILRDLDYLPGQRHGRPVRVRISQEVIFPPQLTRIP